MPEKDGAEDKPSRQIILLQSPAAVLWCRMMDQAEIDWFRAQLIAQRERVVLEVENHGSFPELEDGDDGMDPEEQAVRATDDLVEARLTEDRGNLLQKIDLALSRLEAGIYQQCENCGKTIPKERLRAKPSASLCVACQEEKDGS